MKFRTALLCNHAEVRDALLYIHGGSPEWWNIPEVPAETQLTVALVLEGAAADQQLELFAWVHPADVAPDVRQAGRAAVLPVRDPDTFVHGAPLYTPMVIQLGCRFDRVGGWQVTFFVDGAVAATIPFGVRVR